MAMTRIAPNRVQVDSSSEPGSVHEVTWDGERYHCTCAAGVNDINCWHANAVAAADDHAQFIPLHKREQAYIHATYYGMLHDDPATHAAILGAPFERPRPVSVEVVPDRSIVALHDSIVKGGKRNADG